MVKKIAASHILVKHEYEAQDLLRALEKGQSFESLATKFSQCPSAKQQGDLGEFTLGRMVEEFEEAVLALKPSEISKQPVRTKFGYHLIRRNA